MARELPTGPRKGPRESFPDVLPKLSEVIASDVQKQISEKGEAPEGWEDFMSETPEGEVTPASADETPEVEEESTDEVAAVEADFEEDESEVEEAPRDRAQKRYHDLVDQRNAAEEERDTLRRELAELKAQQAESARVNGIRGQLTENLPEGFEDWTQAEQLAYVTAKVTQPLYDKIESLEKGTRGTVLERTVRENHPKLTRKQVAAVVKIAEANTTLSTQDALAIARSRSPATFGGKTSPTEAMPRSHRTSPPGSAKPPTSKPSQAQEVYGDLVEGVKRGQFKSSGARQEMGKRLVQAAFLPKSG